MLSICRPLVIYEDKIIVDIGKDFGDFYFRMIPKYYRARSLRYPAHISVIRNFENYNSFPLHYNYKMIRFYYDPCMKFENDRFFLNCWSDELITVRNLSGLNNYRTGYNSFHISIGKL